jgi:bla regulator protein BlaR1
MLVLWMGYTVLLGAVAAGAAVVLERGVPSRRRWLWAAAQLVVLALPLVRPLLRTLGRGSASLDVVFGPVAPVMRGALPDLGAVVASSPTLADLQGPLVGTWIGASVVLLVLVLGGMLRTRRLRRSWRAHRVDGSEVLLSDDLGPAVVGLRRPAIVLPKWVLDLAPAERALILAHEEEHRRGGDPALLAAALAVPVLMPWNPAAWFAFARLRVAGGSRSTMPGYSST